MPAQPVTIKLYTATAELQQALAQDAQRVNMLTPIGSRIDFIPPLCAISMRVVQISQDPLDGDCYEPLEAKGMRALGKVALSKIAAAAGVSFSITNRVDDGRDPHYCEVQVVATYRMWDGSWRSVPGSKAMDLRDGSAQVQGKTEANVKQQRAAILRHAETKARLAALREAFSIKAHYRPDELERPFVVPVLVFTGQTDDPEIRKLVAVRMLDMYSASAGQLYGGTSGGLALPPAARPAPAIGSGNDEDEDQVPQVPISAPQQTRELHRCTKCRGLVEAPDMGAHFNQCQAALLPESQRAATTPAAAPATTAATRAAPPAAATTERQGGLHLPATTGRPPASTPAPSSPSTQAQPAQRAAASSAPRGGVAIASFPFGDWKNHPFDTLTVDALLYYQRSTKASLDNPAKANFREKNQGQLVTIEARLRQLGHVAT